MKHNELGQKSAQELQDHIVELRREQFNLRMQKGSGQLNHTHHIRRVRREIARAKMLLGAKVRTS